MQLRTKKISIPKGYYSVLFFIWFIAVIMIIPYKARLSLLFILLSSIMIMLYVSFPSLRCKFLRYRLPRKTGIIKAVPSTRYDTSLFLMFSATLFGSLSAICMAHLGYISIELTLIFSAAFALCALASFKYYLLNIGPHKGEEQDFFSSVTKLFGLILFSGTLALSAKFIMDFMDVPDTQAVSKKTTIAFQFILLLYIVHSLLPISYLPFMAFEKKALEVKTKSGDIRTYLVRYSFFQ